MHMAPSVPCAGSAGSLPSGLCGLSSLEVNSLLFPNGENGLSVCNFQACLFGEVLSTFFPFWACSVALLYKAKGVAELLRLIYLTA